MNHGPSMLTTLIAAMAGGSALVILGHRLRIPIIIPLLFGGIVMGPELLGIVQPDSLGRGLVLVVNLSVALILFEGGLDLDIEGYKRASLVIRRLLSVGVLVTWGLTTLLIVLLLDLSLPLSVLAASMVIVTGPTVVSPLLRRIKVNPRLNDILYWEGVLIDPIGVFIAVLCFEFIHIEAPGFEPVIAFLMRFVVGAGIGLGVGALSSEIMKRGAVADEHANSFMIVTALISFGLCESLFPEAGLLGVIVTGFFLGIRRATPVGQYRKLKEEISEFLIGVLFIILAARLKLESFTQLGWSGLLLVLGVIVLVRPLNILVSSHGTDLSLREKAFLAYVAPRGIVAASMASLFSIQLSGAGIQEASLLEPFVYAVIGSTVILQGLTAGPVASLLNVRRPAPLGWVIVGAHGLGRQFAAWLNRQLPVPSILLDTNAENVAAAQAEGLMAIQADAADPELVHEERISGVGNFLALTDNASLNTLLCQAWGSEFGRSHCHRWAPRDILDREGYGEPTWGDIEKPSSVSHDLLSGTAHLEELPASTPEQGTTDILLAAVQNGRVQLNGKAGESRWEDLPRLVLRKRKPRLSQYLHPNLILRCEADTVEKTAERMVDLLAAYWPNLDKKETIHGLMERERSFSTALGKQVAVPHIYVPGLHDPLCAVALLDKGVDFGAHDNQPVRIAFFLLSPPDDPQRHLNLLAAIARLAWNAQAVDRLLKSQTPEEFIQSLRGFESEMPG